MPPSSARFTVLFPQEGESWNALLERMKTTAGELIVILTTRERELLDSRDVCDIFLKECAKLSVRLRLATKEPDLVDAARRSGIRVLDRTTYIRQLLEGHPQEQDALRAFSPHLWQLHLKNRLLRLGLLSVPKLRILLLVIVSAALFLFVVFRLLPSAQISIAPRQEPFSQTANVFLVQSGALVDLPPRVRIMPLFPLRVTAHLAFTFDQISKEFTGTSANVQLTIVNTAQETYSFRKGTRLVNQAGMVFRTQEAVAIPQGREVTITAVADDTDQYGEIIGERGNVPAGLKWEIPGLAPEERRKVFGENRTPGTDGTTSFRTVLNQEDIDLSRRKLEEELLIAAKRLVEEERTLRNARQGRLELRIIAPQYDRDKLIVTTYSGFLLPTEFLGEPVTSVPVEGSIAYTEFAYDAQGILDLLRKEMLEHVRDGKEIIEESLQLDRLDVRVIAFADDLTWIKLTVELQGTDRYTLDPISPTGALFARGIRERVAGLPRADAERILKNMPEVEDVTISIWPPWSRTLPRIPAHIGIVSR